MKIVEKVVKVAPEILIGVGLSAMMVSIISCGKNAPKAKEAIKKEEGDKERQLTKKEIVKVTYRYYVPTAVMFIAGATCMIASNSTYAKRSATLAAAYALSETARTEFKAKAKEVLGDDKVEKVYNEIAKDKVSAVEPESIISTGRGDVLCYDCLSGRYFRSDIEQVKQAINRFDRMIITEWSASLNELYYELNLDPIAIGEDLGWNLDNGLTDPIYTAVLNRDGIPCLAIEFGNIPIMGYNKH